MTIDTEEILDQLAAVVELYSRKNMARALNKPYSSLSNELRHVEYAKLGFMTALAILDKAMSADSPRLAREAAFEVLARICRALDHVAYRIPPIGGNGPMIREMRLMGRLGREFGENMTELANAIEDGQWTTEELNRCLAENRDLIKACLEVESYLKRISETIREVN